MIETVIRKRIEILTDEPLVRRVTEAIERAGITGWSMLRVEAGMGRDGSWREERVTGTKKSLIVSIASEEKAGKLAQDLAPILNSHGMLLTMWNVEVIRGERFE